MAGVVLTFAGLCTLLLVKEIKSAIHYSGMFEEGEERSRRKPPAPNGRRARPAAAATESTAAPVTATGPMMDLPTLADLPGREPVFIAVPEPAPVFTAAPEPAFIPVFEEQFEPTPRSTRLPEQRGTFCPDRIASILASFDDEETSPATNPTATPRHHSRVFPGPVDSTEKSPSDEAPALAFIPAPTPVPAPEPTVDQIVFEAAPEPLEEIGLTAATSGIAPSPEFAPEVETSSVRAHALPQRPPAPVSRPHPLEIFRPDETRMALGLKPLADDGFSNDNRRRKTGAIISSSDTSGIGKIAGNTRPARRRKTTPVPKNPRDTLLSAGMPV